MEDGRPKDRSGDGGETWGIRVHTRVVLWEVWVTWWCLLTVRPTLECWWSLLTSSLEAAELSWKAFYQHSVTCLTLASVLHLIGSQCVSVCLFFASLVFPLRHFYNFFLIRQWDRTRESLKEVQHRKDLGTNPTYWGGSGISITSCAARTPQRDACVDMWCNPGRSRLCPGVKRKIYIENPH